MTADLRSDTLTQPSEGMRTAMATALVGDDVYGEDPTVNELEARMAALLGHEAGLYTPTGSLANMLGVRVLVEPGTELLADSLAHVLRAELGGHGALGGITSRTWVSRDGGFHAEDALAMMSPDDAGGHMTPTAAIAVENTHNFYGGRIAPLDQLQALYAGASAAGVAVHVDGARLANAHVATGVPLETYGRLADSVSFCLSKGLGAPVGSVLVGSAERIARARVLRKRYGAGMRQVGVLAAAGLWALEHNIERLAEDHARARLIAAAVAEARPDVISLETVETNIAVLQLGPEESAPALAARAAERGLRISALGPRTLRFVTHLDVTDADAARAAEILPALLAR